MQSKLWRWHEWGLAERSVERERAGAKSERWTKHNVGTVAPKLNDSVDDMLPTIRSKYAWLDIIKGISVPCHRNNKRRITWTMERWKHATSRTNGRTESSHGNWRRYIFKVLVIAYIESCDSYGMHLWGEQQIHPPTNSKLDT